MEAIKVALEKLEKLQKLVGEAEKRECPDMEFARRFLPFSATTLSRIRGGVYKGNLEHVAEQAMQAAEEIEARLDQIRAQAQTDQTFVRTKLACATLAAVQHARDKRGRRVVVVLAPTGAGKTAVGEYLAQRGAVYVEGRQSWRNSYKAFCADVADAAGRPLRVRAFSERDAEREMLAALRIRDGVLYIDEANTLGTSTVNAIKLIVNQTGYSVVIAAIPEMWDKFLQGAENEVRQVVNRCQPILRYTGLSEADVKPFLANCGLSTGDVDAATPLARQAANEFGAFKTVVGLAEKLRRIDGPTMEDVTKELRFHSANYAQAGIAKPAGGGGQ